jgi:hypothetical protein
MRRRITVKSLQCYTSLIQHIIQATQLFYLVTSPRDQCQRVRCVNSSVSDPDWNQIQSGQWIRIRIQEGKNDPQKQNKVILKFHVSQASSPVAWTSWRPRDE